jgi:hypothetical protein
MTQALYIVPQLVFEKTAAETALPEDPNQWIDAVLQELYKQVPYLADFDMHVNMETVDGERGYGLGHVEVTNKTEAPMTSPPEQLKAAGIRTARIPVIIKDGKLSPFDVVLTDDARALPLTEGRLRQAMFRPQNFDVTSKTPGDQSMIGQLYPPYRQNYGFGGGGVSAGAGMGGKTASKVASLEQWLESECSSEKTAAAVRSKQIHGMQLAALDAAVAKSSTKTASILEAVLQTSNVTDLQAFKESLRDPNIKLAFAENVATHDSILRIGAANPSTIEKRASVLRSHIRPSVTQVIKLASGYAVKTASHHAWDPSDETVDRGEVVRRYGSKVALAADMSGSATMADGEGVSEAGMGAPLGTGAGPISAPGMYQVQAVDGEMLTGMVLPNLLDTDGSSLPIALFTDGVHAAVQSDISGVPVGEFTPPGSVPAEQASGHGVFFTDAGGVPCATLPLTLGATMQGPGTDEQPRYQAETFDGRQVQVSVQPYVATVVGVDGTMIIPEGWCWIPLDQATEISLAESPVDVGKTASIQRQLASVEVRAGGTDCFSLRGFPVEKLASDEREFLTQDRALFVLVGLGANPSYAQQKLASACAGSSRVETVRVGHQLKLASELRGESYTAAQAFLESTPVFRHRLWKEAAAITDPVAVDTVLSLGFINPENLATYVGYLPTLDEAQRRLCELLIGSRIGLREVPEGSIERAIRALEDVIEGLKVIAFQG